MEHGFELLNKEAIHRIHDGKGTNIWRDNSLSRDGALKVTGKKENTRLRLVSDLFGNGSNGWNENLIENIFLPHDAEEILKIKVPSSGGNDFIAWHYEKHGVFSVKSA